MYYWHVPRRSAQYICICGPMCKVSRLPFSNVPIVPINTHIQLLHFYMIFCVPSALHFCVLQHRICPYSLHPTTWVPLYLYVHQECNQIFGKTHLSPSTDGLRLPLDILTHDESIALQTRFRNRPVITADLHLWNCDPCFHVIDCMSPGYTM